MASRGGNEVSLKDERIFVLKSRMGDHPPDVSLSLRRRRRPRYAMQLRDGIDLFVDIRCGSGVLSTTIYLFKIQSDLKTITVVLLNQKQTMPCH